jgi:hypothetical protein
LGQLKCSNFIGPGSKRKPTNNRGYGTTWKVHTPWKVKLKKRACRQVSKSSNLEARDSIPGMAATLGSLKASTTCHSSGLPIKVRRGWFGLSVQESDVLCTVQYSTGTVSDKILASGRTCGLKQNLGIHSGLSITSPLGHCRHPPMRARTGRVTGLGSREFGISDRFCTYSIAVLRADDSTSHGGEGIVCLILRTSPIVRDARGFPPPRLGTQVAAPWRGQALNAPAPNPPFTGLFLALAGAVEVRAVPGLSPPTLKAPAGTPNLGASNQLPAKASRRWKASIAQRASNCCRH